MPASPSLQIPDLQKTHLSKAPQVHNPHPQATCCPTMEAIVAKLRTLRKNVESKIAGLER